jgi:hypothetical protein
MCGRKSRAVTKLGRRLLLLLLLLEFDSACYTMPHPGTLLHCGTAR